MPPGGPPGPGAGYPPGGYHSGYPSAPGAFATGGSRRKRAIGLSVLALAVVGAVVAVVIVLLGDDGDGGAVKVQGKLTDPVTGLTVPHFAGWTLPDPEDSPADQAVEGPCPGSSASRDPDASASSESSDSTDSSGSSDSETDRCYRAGISVDTQSGEDGFEALIAELKKEVTEDEDLEILDFELDKPVKVDGHPAHVLRARVKGGEGLNTPTDTVWQQIVVIDAPDADGDYPYVAVILEDSPAAPDKSVLDQVTDGIEVGEPRPSESAS